MILDAAASQKPGCLHIALIPLDLCTMRDLSRTQVSREPTTRIAIEIIVLPQPDGTWASDL
jgi:hypothetical protein